MKTNLKQELAKQWFKNLQEIICKNIEEIENNKVLFESKKWSKEIQIKMKVVESLNY